MRFGDVGVDFFHQFDDFVAPFAVGFFEGFKGGADDDRGVVA